MKKLWKAVKREFDLWKKRRAYFKQLEKEFEKKLNQSSIDARLSGYKVLPKTNKNHTR